MLVGTALTAVQLQRHYFTDMKKRGAPYIEQGVTEGLALRVANLMKLYSGCDIVRLAIRWRLDVFHVAKGYFAIGTRFKMGRLSAAVEGLDSDSHWQQLAIAVARRQLRTMVDVTG